MPRCPRAAGHGGGSGATRSVNPTATHHVAGDPAQFPVSSMSKDRPLEIILSPQVTSCPVFPMSALSLVPR